MQQLFPAEGEKVPRLRFPEFRDAGEWKEKPLSSAIELISGMHLSPDQYGEHGDIPYFTGPSDFTNSIDKIKKWTNLSSNIAHENSILITVKGSGVGELWLLELSSVSMGRQLMAINTKEGYSNRFVYQFLNNKKSRFIDLASGNLIPGLSRSDINSLRVLFPNELEQRKIGNTLFTIQKIIDSLYLKIESLKNQKNGLVQQLYPTNYESI